MILSGTPLQNKYEEIWSLFDFGEFPWVLLHMFPFNILIFSVSKGALLGDKRTFKEDFVDRIMAGSHREASQRCKLMGQKMIETLRAITAPFFLRRQKSEITLRQLVRFLSVASCIFVHLSLIAAEFTASARRKWRSWR